MTSESENVKNIFPKNMILSFQIAILPTEMTAALI